MNNLLQKFTLAVDELSINSKPLQERVYRADHNHLSDIVSDDLPEEILIVFDAVSKKLIHSEPIKDFGNDEASYFAKDLRYMFGVIRSLDRYS